MSANRNQVLQYFKKDDIPSEEQFAFAWGSVWFKDENISTTDIQGLSEMFQETATTQQLNNHTQDETAHTAYLTKKDGSNIDVSVWKQLLDIVNIATVDQIPFLGNVFTKEQVQAVFDDIMTNVNNIRDTLASDDYDLDELQEIVNFIKQNREDIEALQAVIIGATTDDKVTLTGDYSAWGALTKQNQFNDTLFNKVGTIEDQLNVGKIKHREVIQVNTDIFHEMDAEDVIVVAKDTVTNYYIPVRSKWLDPDNTRIEFDDLPVNPLEIIIKKI